MIAMALTDVCWAYYFINVEERKSLSAGLWASALFLFGASVTTNYVQDKTLIFAALLGSFIGTYATIEFKKYKEKNKKNGEQS